MPAKPSGEIKTSKVSVRQKNGDIYVYQRSTKYDPVKKYNVTLESKLLGKIPRGESELVSTRPKSSSSPKTPKAEQAEKTGTKIAAKRSCVGMMEILEHVGFESSIDSAIYGSTELGTAQKTISLARYFLATNGQSAPGITTWQLTHKMPYESGFTESVYHELFKKIGYDETFQQNFFRLRCSKIGSNSVIAYDSTTISTYSQNQKDAVYGYNKDGDGLKTIKILTLYSIDNMLPIAFSKQPGNIPDVVCIKNALNELSVLGIETAEIVTDNGYYSISNIAELLFNGFNFITLIKTNIKWVKSEIVENFDELNSIETLCPFDASIHGVTVKLMHIFTRNEYNISDNEINSEKKFKKEIYLHLYFSAQRQAEERMQFDLEMYDLKERIEKREVTIDDLDANMQKKVNKYLNIIETDSAVNVSFKKEQCKEAYKYAGFFALISNKEKSTFDCLKKYRKRNKIESFFKYEKNIVDGRRPRVWDSFTLRGRLFVQFVSLCYYEYLHNKIDEIKRTLGVENGDNSHDKKVILNRELKLRSWLENTPIYLQLQWFDTIESIEISSEIKKKRWNTEVLLRDRLFLEKLGVTLPKNE